MSDILKISEAASIGLHAMAVVAAAGGERVSGKSLARRLEVSLAHLSKVMQRLVKAGYVDSSRGPGGGFKLSRPAREITLAEIYEAIEGPLTPARCLLDNQACNGKCLLGGLIARVHEQVRAHMQTKTLADMKTSFKPS